MSGTLHKVYCENESTMKGSITCTTLLKTYDSAV